MRRDRPDSPRILTLLGSPERRLLLGALLKEGCALVHGNPAANPVEAVRANAPDLVLLDLELPEISGLEVVGRMRRDPLLGDLPIVGLGTEDVDGMHQAALMAGCSGFIADPLQAETFPAKIEWFLGGFREEVSAEDRLRYSRVLSEILTEKLERRLELLERKTSALEAQRERERALMLQVLSSLVTLIEAKDPYLKGHSGRVTAHAMALGRAVGLKGEEIRTLERACLLHDIGKISIDITQINKPGPLSDEEWALIRQHPATGFRILWAIDFLQEEALVTRYHHLRHEVYAERPDIPARIRTLTAILSIADAFDAMTTQRPYNSPRSLGDACAELQRCAGTQFDPLLVEAFVHLLRDSEPT